MKTKTRFHKLTAWLLTLAMLMTFTPTFSQMGMDLTAYAIDGTGSDSDDSEFGGGTEGGGGTGSGEASGTEGDGTAVSHLAPVYENGKIKFDSNNDVVFETQTVTEYSVAESIQYGSLITSAEQMPKIGTSGETTWYVADSDIEWENFVLVQGDVHLVICDDAKITSVYGIVVSEGNSLTIYGQENGTGTLVADGTSYGAGFYSAAIGGCDITTDMTNSGSITINGGKITATGSPQAAAIGGSNRGNGGEITINGGTVDAEGASNSAAIGGGSGGNSGIITINGGTVTATKDTNGSAIGTGYVRYVYGKPDDCIYAKADTISINGGTVVTNITSNSSSTYPAIGGEFGFDNISISGGHITINHGRSDGIGIGTSSVTAMEFDGNLNISGGTIVSGTDYQISIGSRASSSSPKGTVDVVVTGGNISGTIKNPTTLTDGTNNVVKKEFSLVGAENKTPVTEVEGYEEYGLTDVVTDDEKLTIYVAEKGEPQSIKTDENTYLEAADGVYGVEGEKILSFNANGGTGAMSSISFSGSESKTLPVNEFTRSYYKFTGWNTSTDGEGTSYEDCESINITENTVLYAQWEQITYNVTFNPGDGTGTMTDDTAYAAASNNYTLPECTYTPPEGKLFRGWKVGTSSTIRIPGTKVTVSADTTVTAVWEDPIVEVTVDGITTKYPSLEQVIPVVKDKIAEIKVIKEFSVTSTTNIYANELVIDLNGYTISGYIFSFYCNSELKGPGTIKVSNQLRLRDNFRMTVGENVNITRTSGTSATSYAVQAYSGSTLILNGGSVTCTSTTAPAIYSTGTAVVVNADGVTSTFSAPNVYYNITPTTAPTNSNTSGKIWYKIDNSIENTNVPITDEITTVYDEKIYGLAGKPVTIVPNAGYTLADVKVNGNDATAVSDNYTFTMPTGVATLTGTASSSHTHVWKYELVGTDTIKATCTADGCPDTDVKTIVISASGKEYNGEAVTATVTNTVDSTDYSASIVYEAKTGSLTEGKAVNVGTYTAKITVGGVSASVDFTIEQATINNVTIDVTASEAVAVPQTTVTAGTGYSADIMWSPATEKFGFNTSYTATVTLTADGNHKFADTLSRDGWTVALNNDKTVATFTKTFEKTRMQKIEGVDALSNVNLDSHKSDAAAVIATLPTTVSVDLEENGTDNLAIVWSCADFNTAPLSENTFTWNATNNKYDSNNVALTGTITVTNPAANAVTITVKTENTTLVYNASDIDLTSLFNIDTNAGNATYTVTNGTGIGTQSGTALTVTKAGTFTVKVDTTANGIYAAGSQTATLTVNKANGTGTVSMEGWTYGETAKAPAISANKGEATYQYKARGADDSTYSSEKPSNAGEYTVKATFAETDLYNEAFATADFAIAKKDITGATVGAFAELTYTGGEQTPTANVTIDGLTVTGAWSNVTNVADTTTFTANGNFTGTIADKETGMAKANSSVTTAPNANTITYNEAAQELVTVGAANGGTLKYRLDNATWNDAIPTGTNADAYEVWYKVFGDANHNDTDAVKVDVTIAKKSIEDATVALDGELTYNGAEQTQNVTVTLDGFTVTFDVADNKATDVKADGNYTLKVTAYGNFEGEKTLEWNIAKADHTIEGENIPTASRIRRGNKLSTSTITPAELKDAEENVLGTFDWVTPDDEMTETGDFVKQVKFTPTDTNNYNEKIFDVTVNVYRPSSGGGGSSSNTTTTTTKNEDGSTTKVTENKATGTKTEVTTNPDGSTSTVETKKDGTVTTTEKDKDGNTTTTVEKPDGTSTTTEKNKDGSEKVTEEKADGTTVTTEKNTDGTKTVTTEKADGTTTTEETKKDGTTVKTETNADGETTAEVEAKGETEVVIPVDNAEDVTKVVVTDKDGKETEVEFEVKDGGVAISVSGNSTVSVQTGHTCYAKDFTDVDLDAWYHLNIDYVLENGLMKGTATDKFAPNDNLTRAMLVTILYRAEDEPATNRSIPFADVDMGSYYANGVIWAQQNGIVKGVSETEFAPNDNITREQIAAILYRYAIYKGMDAVNLSENLTFTDADEISEYAISALNWAVQTGLIKGYEDNTVRPHNNATRAEAAALLQRFIEWNK